MGTVLGAIGMVLVGAGELWDHFSSDSDSEDTDETDEDL